MNTGGVLTAQIHWGGGGGVITVPSHKHMSGKQSDWPWDPEQVRGSQHRYSEEASVHSFVHSAAPPQGLLRISGEPPRWPYIFHGTCEKTASGICTRYTEPIRWHVRKGCRSPVFREAFHYRAHQPLMSACKRAVVLISENTDRIVINFF